MRKIKFEELLGRTGILCGVSNTSFRIGNLTFDVVEDENDGYRSMLGAIINIDNIPATFKEEIIITESNHIDGYELISNKTNKPVLTFGTDENDSYYPMFVFDYNIHNLSTYVDLDNLLNTITD